MLRNKWWTTEKQTRTEETILQQKLLLSKKQFSKGKELSSSLTFQTKHNTVMQFPSAIHEVRAVLPLTSRWSSQPGRLGRHFKTNIYMKDSLGQFVLS